MFNNNFNLSFHTPKKDLCDVCVAYDNMTETERDQDKQQFHIKMKEKAREIKNEDIGDAILSNGKIVSGVFDF